MDSKAMAAVLVSEVEAEVRPFTNRERLEAMYRQHYQSLWRVLRRFGYPPELCADATQQAYLVALERLGDIFLGSERAFLFSTGIRLIKSLARRSQRDQLASDPEVLDGVDLRSVFGDRHAALDVLDRIFSGIEPSLLGVFVLHEIEGFTSPEIAETLEIPIGTVASRLRRAREAFRERARLFDPGTTGIEQHTKSSRSTP